MGRRTGVAAAVAVAMAVAAPGAAQAKTLVVTKGATASGLCPAGGTNTYAELHQAVAAAAADDTIYLCAAATPYAGAVYATQPGLRIIGVPDILAVPIRIPTIEDSQGVTLMAPGASISGIRIQAKPDAPAFNGLAVIGDDTTARSMTISGFRVGVIAEEGAWVETSTVTGTPSSLAGISISGSNVRLADNTVTGNGGYGIVANIQTRSSDIEGNRVTGNAFSPSSTTGASDAHDCRDFSTGTGTGGTANTWSLNRGRTVKPSGICLPPCRDLSTVGTVIDVLRPAAGPLVRRVCL